MGCDGNVSVVWCDRNLLAKRVDCHAHLFRNLCLGIWNQGQTPDGYRGSGRRVARRYRRCDQYTTLRSSPIDPHQWRRRRWFDGPWFTRCTTRVAEGEHSGDFSAPAVRRRAREFPGVHGILARDPQHLYRVELRGGTSCTDSFPDNSGSHIQ